MWLIRKKCKSVSPDALSLVRIPYLVNGNILKVSHAGLDISTFRLKKAPNFELCIL